MDRRWIPQRLLSALGRLRGTPSNDIDQARTVGAVLAPPPARPSSGASPLVPFTKAHPEAAVVLVAVFGLAPDELIRVLEVVADRCAAIGAVPIFLTDSHEFQPFRSRRLLFEYLPPPSQGTRFAPNLDWDLYRQRRLALLRRKWQPGRIVAFGPTASAVLSIWRQSPFEDPTIAEVIVGGDGSPAVR